MTARRHEEGPERPTVKDPTDPNRSAIELATRSEPSREKSRIAMLGRHGDESEGRKQRHLQTRDGIGLVGQSLRGGQAVGGGLSRSLSIW